MAESPATTFRYRCCGKDHPGPPLSWTVVRADRIATTVEGRPLGCVGFLERDEFQAGQRALACRERLDRRDEDDWPVLAAALALGCPTWTEDPDFFGCGVATWTTDRVELYLAKAEREV